MNTLTKFEGNNTYVLQTNNAILLDLYESNKDRFNVINGLPFYSGGEFKLPQNKKLADNMIDIISKNIDSISNPTSFVDAGNLNADLEKEDSDVSIEYKKLLIRAYIIIHWKLKYLDNNNASKPSRVNFILKILEKLFACSKDYWGKNSEYTAPTISDVINSLLNGDELDVVMMNFPTKALHIYGW